MLTYIFVTGNIISGSITTFRSGSCKINNRSIVTGVRAFRTGKCAVCFRRIVFTVEFNCACRSLLHFRHILSVFIRKRRLSALTYYAYRRAVNLFVKSFYGFVIIDFSFVKRIVNVRSFFRNTCDLTASGSALSARTTTARCRGFSL